MKTDRGIARSSRRRRNSLDDELMLLRNTILIGLPSTILPDSLDGFQLDGRTRLLKVTERRKSQITRSAEKIALWDDRDTFQSIFSSTDWFIELRYQEGFSLIEYVDFREDKVINLIKTLLTMVTLDWRRLWIAFTYRTPRSEYLVMAYQLSSPWMFQEEFLTLDAERKSLSEKHIRMYKSYRRRLGMVGAVQGPLSVATDFYCHHLTLGSEHMRALALCVALESLFNVGPHEIRRTIGLCAAALLGKNLEEKKKIYGEVTKLYDYRSEISHGTLRLLRKSGTEGEFKDLVSLHDYTRRCLRVIIEKRRLTLAFMDSRKRVDAINQALLTGAF